MSDTPGGPDWTLGADGKWHAPGDAGSSGAEPPPGYGQPAQPGYGQDPYGQPAQPYGVPPGGAPYGAGTLYGAMPPPPGMGMPPAGYGYQPPVMRGTNGYAIASFVLGLIGIFIIPILFSVIFGFVGLGQIKKSQQTGSWMAVLGLLLSAFWIVVYLAVIISALHHLHCTNGVCTRS